MKTTTLLNRNYLKSSARNVFLLTMSVLTFTSCGKSSSGGNAGTTVNGQGGVNPVTGQATGACIPLGTAIGFTANNIYMDYANIVGGQIPFSTTSAGQMVTGGALTGGAYSSYGTSQVAISMNLQNPVGSTTLPYTGYPSQSLFNQNYYGSYNTYPYGYNNMNQGSNRVSGNGMIQLSQMVIQDIQYKVASGQIIIPGYTPGNYVNTYPGVQTGVATGIPSYYTNGIQPNAGLPNICISGIALNIGRYNTRLYGGQIYLYLNGSSHGYVTGIY